MEAVLRAAAIYFFLLFVMRVAGRRTLSEVTTFDFVLLLVIGEATQQALLGEDFSLTNGFLVILTLIAIDLGMSFLQRHVPRLDKWIAGEALVLVENGRPIRHVMAKVRVEAEDILESARTSQGLERMEQIKFAVLERSGQISIIPKEGAGG